MGLRTVYDAIKTANGPAQHVTCSLVGLSYAGMYAGMVPDPILLGWAATSALIIVSVIWLPKIILKFSLLADFVFSALVLTFYFMHKPAPKGFVYYSSGSMQRGYNPTDHGMSLVEQLSHGSAVVLMAAWSLYLSNLVHRQILERKRFDARA